MVFSDNGLGKEDVIWTLGFRPDHDIPVNGYLKIEFPNEIRMKPGEVMAKGYCAKVGCKWTWPQSSADEQ